MGANRHQDIRGTFVNVPPDLTPGLAAQDGKFFEKSWAISLGPTGGVLIGVGPFEVIAETQLRFMGGLSDVDWLVEEGLQRYQHRELALVVPVSAGRALSGSERRAIMALTRARRDGLPRSTACEPVVPATKPVRADSLRVLYRRKLLLLLWRRGGIRTDSNPR